MARTQGTFPFSSNLEVQIRAELDARKSVPNYSDLLAFTEVNKIPDDFLVVCGGKDDPTKRGIWLFKGGDANLSDPNYWELVASGDVSALLIGFPEENDFPDYNL